MILRLLRIIYSDRFEDMRIMLMRLRKGDTGRHIETVKRIVIYS